MRDLKHIVFAAFILAASTTTASAGVISQTRITFDDLATPNPTTPPGSSVPSAIQSPYDGLNWDGFFYETVDSAYEASFLTPKSLSNVALGKNGSGDPNSPYGVFGSGFGTVAIHNGGNLVPGTVVTPADLFSLQSVWVKDAVPFSPAFPTPGRWVQFTGYDDVTGASVTTGKVFLPPNCSGTCSSTPTLINFANYGGSPAWGQIDRVTIAYNGRVELDDVTVPEPATYVAMLVAGLVIVLFAANRHRATLAV